MIQQLPASRSISVLAVRAAGIPIAVSTPTSLIEACLSFTHLRWSLSFFRFTIHYVSQPSCFRFLCCLRCRPRPCYRRRGQRCPIPWLGHRQLPLHGGPPCGGRLGNTKHWKWPCRPDLQWLLKHRHHLQSERHQRQGLYHRCRWRQDQPAVDRMA